MRNELHHKCQELLNRPRGRGVPMTCRLAPRGPRHEGLGLADLPIRPLRMPPLAYSSTSGWYQSVASGCR